ncbi:MAG TPA: hypothetical protein PKM63_11820 [Panacibacter sp.]|nr:hypothetical protein [Panacibacter sp.]HNP44967.1 hypothetical protein [Panacibacter sp.]
MKRTFVKIVHGKFLPGLVLATALIGAAPLTGMAKNNHTIEIISTENASSVKFSGSTENAFLFDVKISNPKADKFTLTIRSSDGDVLYSQEFSDANFSKKIKLLKGGAENRYSFSVTSTNKDLQNSFVISATTKEVDDVTVTKL